ncbi:MAG: hypothetical protein Q9163_000221 [Psora crenata]
MVLLYSGLGTLSICSLLTFASAVGVAELAVPANLAESRPPKSSPYQFPTRFTVIEKFFEHPLNLTDTLLVTAETLAYIAQIGPESVVVPPKNLARPMKRVAIDLIGLAAKDRLFKRKYATWGLAHAATVMARDRKFVESKFFLYWDDVEVGAIKFTPDLSDANSLDAGTEINKTTAINVTVQPARTKDHNATRDLAAEEGLLSVENHYFNGDMKIIDAFLTVIHLMADAAAQDASEIVSKSKRYTDLRTQVRLTYRRIGRFYYSDLFHSLAVVPRTMSEDLKSMNVRFLIKKDGVPIAIGAMEK